MTNKIGIKDYYDSFGTVYELVWSDQIHVGFFDDSHEKSLKDACRDMTLYLANKSNFSQGQRLLDVGCGQGGTDRILINKYKINIDGIDLSSEQIRKANERAVNEKVQDSIRYCIGSMDNLPFEDFSFDHIWCQESFSYSADKLKTIKEFNRVLKRGGLLMVEDVILADENSRLEVKKSFGGRSKIDELLTRDILRKVFEEVGFSLIELIDLSSNLIETYQKVNEGINKNRSYLIDSLPESFHEGLVNNFNFPSSQKLAEDGKIGDIVMWFKKP